MASGTERLIYENDCFRQGNLLTVGKGRDFDQIPKSNDATKTQGTEGESLEKGASSNFLSHLLSCLSHGYKRSLTLCG